MQHLPDEQFEAVRIHSDEVVQIPPRAVDPDCAEAALGAAIAIMTGSAAIVARPTRLITSRRLIAPNGD